MADVQTMPLWSGTRRFHFTALLWQLLPILSVPAVLVMWELTIWFFSIEPFIFPAPSAVLTALWSGVSSGVYLTALQITLTAILVGFASGSFIGFCLGVLLHSVEILYRIVFPWIISLQTIPKVAIAPLIIVWAGFGIESKILIVTLTCAFPVLVNTMAGLRAVDQSRLDLVRAHGGRRFHLLRYVQFPSALPYVFAGLHTAMVLAVIGAIVGEFVGARNGIGVQILRANFNLDLAAVFSLLTLLAIVGVTLNSAIRFAERKICFWNGKKS